MPTQVATAIPHLPALRFGDPYESLEATTLDNMHGGGTIAEVSQVNSGLIRRDILKIKEMRRSLDSIKAEELVDICKRAGEYFLNGELPLADGIQSSEDYVEQLSSTTGLPHTLCRSNMLKVHHVLTNMDIILKGLTRGISLDIFDKLVSKHGDLTVSYCPLADCMGVVLPSNSPGVNSLWLPAVIMKVPVILKPGREDPWTPYRLIQALIAAGCPKELFGYYPTGHEGSNSILSSCGRAIVFGGDATVKNYAGNPNVQIHGAGRSKILIGADCADNWEDYIDLMVDAIAANSGRSCVNASAIITPAHGDAIASAIAERLSKLEPLAYDDDKAVLAGFANPAMADFIEASLESGLAEDGAEDITAKFRSGPVRVEKFGQNYLLPTIVRCETLEHPLGNTEFLFPYASVIELSQSEMLEKIGPSLVVSAITKDREWIKDLLEASNVDRLNVGALPTNAIQWDQPHEGNLFEFLFRRRAIYIDGGAV